MSKEMKNIEKITSPLPEAFYDVLAYIVSSTFFFIGTIYSIGFIDQNLTKITLPQFSWVWDLLIGFIIFGSLYCIGLILTTYSYYVIQKPIKFILIKTSKLDKNVVQKKLYLIFLVQVH